MDLGSRSAGRKSLIGWNFINWRDTKEKGNQHFGLTLSHQPHHPPPPKKTKQNRKTTCRIFKQTVISSCWFVSLLFVKLADFFESKSWNQSRLSGFPETLLPGSVRGQHNSVKLQHSLAFNFPVHVFTCKTAESTTKELAFLAPPLKMCMQSRCCNSPGIQSSKSHFTSLSGKAHYGWPDCIKTTLEMPARTHTPTRTHTNTQVHLCSFTEYPPNIHSN